MRPVPIGSASTPRRCGRARSTATRASTPGCSRRWSPTRRTSLARNAGCSSSRVTVGARAGPLVRAPVVGRSRQSKLFLCSRMFSLYYERMFALSELRDIETALRGLVGELTPEDVPAAYAMQVFERFAMIERLAASAKTLVARRVEEAGGYRSAGCRTTATAWRKCQARRTQPPGGCSPRQNTSPTCR